MYVFLVHVKAELPTITQDDEYKIKRYLNLQRQILRAPNDKIYSLEMLSVRGEYIEDLVDMIGAYWIWRYTEEDIVQIRMTIQKDFTVQIEHPLYSGTNRNQIGRLNSSRIFNHNLCISTYPNRVNAQQVLSYYMVEIPQGKNWKYLKGNYCNVGGPNYKPSGGALALYKQQDELLDIEPQVIRRENLTNYLDVYPEFLQLKTMLDIQSGKLVK